MMYGTLIRFYQTMIKLQVLDNMKEDLIDLLTKMIFSHEHMSTLLLSLSRICTKDEEM